MKELELIVSVIRDEDIDTLFAEHITDFFSEANGVIWQDLKEYYNQYRVMPSIKAVSDKYPTLKDVDATDPVEFYVDSVREDFLNTRISQMLMKAHEMNAEHSAELVLNTMQYNFSKLNTYTSRAHDIDIMDFEEAKKHYDEVYDLVLANNGVVGIPTGIDFIDSSYPTGLQPGDLIVVLGWTGRGKSLLTTLIAARAWDQRGKVPMIVSMEMSANKLRDRVWTILGSGLFKNSDLTLGMIDNASFDDFRNQHKHKKPFIVLNSNGNEVNLNSIQSKFNQHRPDLVILDYAQLMSDNGNNDDMTARMRNLSKEAKIFAEFNQVPVILISSATPDGAVTDSAPTINQVAWSKQLAYDADLAFAVHKYNDSNLIDIVCRKNRNGPLFAGKLDWDIDRGIVSEVNI